MDLARGAKIRGVYCNIPIHLPKRPILLFHIKPVEACLFPKLRNTSFQGGVGKICLKEVYFRLENRKGARLVGVSEVDTVYSDKYKFPSNNLALIVKLIEDSRLCHGVLVEHRLLLTLK